MKSISRGMHHNKNIKEEVAFRDLISVIESKKSNYINLLLIELKNKRIDEDSFCYVLRSIRPSIFMIIDSIKLSKQRFKFCSSNESKINNNEISSLRLLNLLIDNSDLHYSRFRVYFDESDLLKIVDIINDGCEISRPIAISIFQSLRTKYNELSKLCEEITANECVEYILSNRKLESVDFFMNISILQIDRMTYCEVYDYFSQFILPVILKSLDLDGMSYELILQEYCLANKYCQNKSLKGFCKVYESLGTIGRVKIFKYLIFIMESYNFTDSEECIDDQICILINNGFRDESYIVIDSLDEFFLNKSTKIFIDSRIQIILPKFFASMYKSSKNFWKLEQRCKILSIFEYFVTEYHDILESSLIAYNSKKHNTQIENKSNKIEK